MHLEVLKERSRQMYTCSLAVWIDIATCAGAIMMEVEDHIARERRQLCRKEIFVNLKSVGAYQPFAGLIMVV